MSDGTIYDYVVLVPSTQTVVEWAKDWDGSIVVLRPLDDLIVRGMANGNKIELLNDNVAHVYINDDRCAVAFRLTFDREIANYRDFYAAHDGMGDDNAYILDMIRNIEVDMMGKNIGYTIDLQNHRVQRKR